MINKDRIVPIQRTDYLSLLGTIFAVVGFSQSASLTSLYYLKSDDVEGNFTVPDTYSSGDAVILTQPAKSINVDDIQAGAAYFFCAAYDFKGVFASGAEVELNADIKADGVSLYALINDGSDTTVISLSPDVN